MADETRLLQFISVNRWTLQRKENKSELGFTILVNKDILQNKTSRLK
jgi:hypothetical protein